MRSTAPILAIGAITMTNMVILRRQPVDLRVPIATGAAALVFAGAEKVWAPGAVGIAYLALVTTLFVPLGGEPAPIESAQQWWSGAAGKRSGPQYIYT